MPDEHPPDGDSLPQIPSRSRRWVIGVCLIALCIVPAILIARCAASMIDDRSEQDRAIAERFSAMFPNVEVGDARRLHKAHKRITDFEVGAGEQVVASGQIYPRMSHGEQIAVIECLQDRALCQTVADGYEQAREQARLAALIDDDRRKLAEYRRTLVE